MFDLSKSFFLSPPPSVCLCLSLGVLLPASVSCCPTSTIAIPFALPSIAPPLSYRALPFHLLSPLLRLFHLYSTVVPSRSTPVLVAPWNVDSRFAIHPPNSTLPRHSRVDWFVHHLLLRHKLKRVVFIARDTLTLIRKEFYTEEEDWVKFLLGKLWGYERSSGLI